MTLHEDDDDKKVVDEICKEVFLILNALKHPDITNQINESKESIFKRVNDKIETDSTQRIRIKRKQSRFRYFIAVGVLLFVVLSVGTAYYFGHESGKELQAGILVETVAPRGVTTKVTLADGTIVTLNGGSRLTYPTLFSGKQRKVSLSGEGFFEVARDVEHPFVVNAANLSVKVLGTTFGFKSYKGDVQSIVTLKEGSVEAIPHNKEVTNGIILQPDQQLVLNNRTGEFQCRIVNASDYLSWKDGALYFRDTTLEEIVKVLERKFNIKILITSESLKTDRYFAHFGDNENIEQILTLLSHKRLWEYEKKNDVYEIKKKY